MTVYLRGWSRYRLGISRRSADAKNIISPGGIRRSCGCIARAHVSDEYVCKTAATVNEASELIELGFEYVTEMDGLKLFKKPKELVGEVH